MSTQPPDEQPTRRRAKAPPGMERVTLALHHTHNGKRYPPGAEISVQPETARWLRDAGVVSPTTTISNKD